MGKKKVLAIDDERIVLDSIRKILDRLKATKTNSEFFESMKRS